MNLYHCALETQNFAILSVELTVLLAALDLGLNYISDLFGIYVLEYTFLIFIFGVFLGYFGHVRPVLFILVHMFIAFFLHLSKLHFTRVQVSHTRFWIVLFFKLGPELALVSGWDGLRRCLFGLPHCLIDWQLPTKSATPWQLLPLSSRGTFSRMNMDKSRLIQ